MNKEEGRFQHTQCHAQAHIGILNHIRKLLEADLAVLILVRFHDGLVHNLLQLHILQIVANHHLQHDKQLAVGDKPIPVDIVHLERKPQLFFFVPLRTKR